MDANAFLEDGIHPSKREIHKLMKNEIKESIEGKSLEKRVGPLSVCSQCMCSFSMSFILHHI